MNWAGNVEYTANHLHQPSSVEELRRLVAGARQIRALGTRHSFNRVADGPGDLVSVAGLPPEITIDPDGQHVTFSAGLRYGELAQHLHEAGYALRNLGSLPHISVAGAVATGTHGSGVRNGNLATAVAGMQMVTASGDVVALDRSTDGFAGAVVALGALGIVTRLTLDIVPTFQVCQYVYEGLPQERLDSYSAEVLGSGYSVSLFTDWRDNRINQVWVKRRCNETLGWTPPRTWLDATLATVPVHPVPGMPVENCTEQLGVPGPWHERLPHFRLEFTPSSGEELQSEYFVARADGVEALGAIQRIRDRVSPVLQISEVRTIAADDLWLSPAYGRDSLAIHFTWIADTPRVLAVLPVVEEALAPLGARPHWGKLFTMEPSTVAGQYERLPEFAALRRGYDPDGKFSNEMLDRYL
jgi:xylitol oxidase